ncbi:MAG: alpha-galactosidase [Nocardioides sp.]|nr:alpha-galactosidase [Nocardioides sp.]
MSLVLAPAPSGAPVLVHWGGGLGELGEGDLAGLLEVRRPGVPHSALDQPRFLPVVPETGSGFTGTPALEGYRPGDRTRPGSPSLRDWTWQVSDEGPEDDAVVTLEGRDDEAGWQVALELRLTVEGLVRMCTTVTNTAPSELVVAAAHNVLPAGAEATEVLDLTGRWCRERSPQRRAWGLGTHLRQGRHGRTGHDATLLIVAGTPGFGFRTGEVRGVHVAWSGDHTTYAERTAEGENLLGGGELLGPGEVTLAVGDTYTTPWLVGSWSAGGLDPMSHRLHAWVRRHSPRSRAPRPVLLNTWEATYFDHDLERLRRLADAAAGVGVERFVLDDGWFRGRRHDRAGLGDWSVDADVWPRGLHPLIEHVRAQGMEFGLWVEPEMVNVDSDLVRAHPDWVLRGRRSDPPEWRHQQVLDLQVPEAFDHVRSALLTLLDEHRIDYLKWDHNRDLVDVAHAGRPAVHGQTLALYRLLDELRSRHPALEIESCASGGGRVDLGVLAHTDRIWPSDTIDALERQRIQPWTALLVPPELIGTHIGGPEAHTTGRRHHLAFRAATALLGHLGIEWDLTALSSEEVALLHDWVALHKTVRHLVSGGDLVRGDLPDPALTLTGMVAPSRNEGVFVVAAVDSTLTQSPLPLRLPGLAEDRRYLVRNVTPGGSPHPMDLGASWLDGPGVRLPGRVLTQVGLRLPVMRPETAHVIEVRADV